MKKKTVLLSMAALGSAAFVLAYGPQVVDQVSCRTGVAALGGTVNHDHAWFVIPPQQWQRLRDYVQDFADRNHLVFGDAYFPAGTATVEHERLALDVCGRGGFVGFDNSFHPTRFSVFVARQASLPAERMHPAYEGFIDNLATHFQRVEEEAPPPEQQLGVPSPHSAPHRQQLLSK